MISDWKNKIYGAATQVIGSVLPVLSETQFLKKGQLMPSEFVAAGDNLTHKCNTWKWRGCDESKFDKNLPAEKQFLITERVPCLRRISDFERAVGAIQEVHIDGTAQDDALDNMQVVGDLVDDSNARAGASKQMVDNDDDNIPDIDDLPQKQEDAPMRDEEPPSDNIFGDGVGGDDDDEDEEEKKCEGSANRVRMYDLSITYDYYHRTPRLWLQGYSEEGDLLTQDEMFQDILADYARKTVTFEAHPKLPGNQLSIHPCNHATVMKRMIDQIKRNGGEPVVENSLFFFLKFITSVVPTIETDNTIDLAMD